MSAFAANDFNAQRYANLRPTYPDEFYQLLNDYHQGRRTLAIDVGCGPGIATFQLADNLTNFQKIIGTDISPSMIETARANNSKRFTDNIEFVEAPGESFEFLGSGANEGKVDMITAAECVHYFDFVKFQHNVAANLRKGGTWSIWGYGDFFFPDHPRLDDAIDALINDADKLGPHWSQPGRTIATGLLKDYHFDPELFTDSSEVCYHKEDLRGVDPESIPLYMHKELTLGQVQEYIRTWSGYHAWQKANPNAQDVTVWFAEQAEQLYPGLGNDSSIKLVWRTFYMIGRRK